MRRAPYDFVGEKSETKHGKRCVLKPHPTESKYIHIILELRAKGIMHDTKIVQTVNELGFRTRVKHKRDKHDRTKILSKTSGKPQHQEKNATVGELFYLVIPRGI